jgi:hypothetical protein
MQIFVRSSKGRCGTAAAGRGGAGWKDIAPGNAAWVAGPEAAHVIALLFGTQAFASAESSVTLQENGRAHRLTRGLPSAIPFCRIREQH